MVTTPDHRSLEGIPPDRFDGNHAQTQRFLTELKRFMSMNQVATITRTLCAAAHTSCP